MVTVSALGAIKTITNKKEDGQSVVKVCTTNWSCCCSSKAVEWMSSSRRSRRCSSFNCSICFCRSLSGSSPPSCSRRSKASRSYGANRATCYRAGKKNYHVPMRQTEWHIIELERKTVPVLRGKQNDTLSNWKENLTPTGPNRVTHHWAGKKN